MAAKGKSFFSIKMLVRLFHTVRYLKWQQFFYRFYYPVKRKLFKSKRVEVSHIEYTLTHTVQYFPSFSINSGLYNPADSTFIFLNKSKSFGQRINWNFSENGLLWLFNLHYFDWLEDEKVTFEFKLSTIKSYIDGNRGAYVSLHSYPASLRIPNWIKFLITHQIEDIEIKENLFEQAYRLSQFPEYEILGNHLFENGIALVWAGIYFGEIDFLNLGEAIVTAQLKEQILSDGAHFEKSISYHTLILKSLLSLYSFCENKGIFLSNELKIKTSLMMSHVVVVTGNSHMPPMFGDSNEQMTVSLNELSNVAQFLGIKISDIQLGESGYRKYVGNNYELFFNCGNIIANYQPGHSHSDVFNFTLQIKERQVIVDRGVSTYESSRLRFDERSTYSHNTICVNKDNVYDVWAAFRMGKRAEIKRLIDLEKFIEIEHDGYFSKYKIKHRRTITINDFEIIIKDFLDGWIGQDAKIYFHFHPDIVLFQKGENHWVIQELNVLFEILGATTHIEHYEYCIGFNNTRTATRIVGNINNAIVQTKIIL